MGTGTLSELLVRAARTIAIIVDDKWKRLLMNAICIAMMFAAIQIILSIILFYDEEELNGKLTFLMGLTSCILCQRFVARDLYSLYPVVINLAAHAKSMECLTFTSFSWEREMAHVVKRIKIGVTVVSVYTFLVLAEACFKPLILMHPAFKLVPTPSTQSELVLLLLIQITTYLFSIPQFYYVVALHLCTTMAGSLLLQANCVMLREAQGYRVVLSAVRCHSSLLQILCTLQNGYAEVLIPITAFCTAMSLLGAFGVIYGDYNMALLCSPLLLWLLVMSSMSDSLREASELTLDAVYDGFWIQEHITTRRLLLTVMARCTRPAGVFIRGFGVLSKQGFVEIAKKWYSFLMLAINTI